MARPQLQLRGALALVTGAGSGIGQATSLALADEGARVVAVDIDGDAAEKTAAACTEKGPDAHGLTCDVADADAVQALADQVHETWGTLQVLVNNAGVGMSARFSDMTLDDWRWIRGINLDGVVHGCFAFGPAMVEEGRGHVVNVSSMLAYAFHGAGVAYCSTKSAVLAFTQSLRADWGKHGIGVSAICPGGIRTSIVDNGRQLGEDSDGRDRAREALRKARPPEVVAGKIVQAIREDRAVVRVGWEAQAAWIGHRLLPTRLQQFIARVGLR
jgi:2-hydroxycyclohexanecarboxyl-CoA dehydrogenase